MTRKILKPPIFIYEKFIKKQKEGIPFVIFLFFLLTFLTSRVWVYLAIKGVVHESLTQNIKGVHIHHFAWGILLNSIIGFIVLTIPNHYLEKWKVKLAALFGIGLGWTFDEFGMWLRLEDEYWVRQSYDAVVALTLVFINIIYLGNFWKKLGKKIYSEFKK